MTLLLTRDFLLRRSFAADAHVARREAPARPRKGRDTIRFALFGAPSPSLSAGEERSKHRMLKCVAATESHV
ncbi:MAG: hypothetical protein WBE04_09085, partial [Methyloceanibacter sp.]